MGGAVERLKGVGGQAEEGLFAGVASGLNISAAVQLATELGPEHTVVTAAVDTGLKYLAGSLYDV